MEKNNIILIAIIVLVVALIAVGAYIFANGNAQADVVKNATNNTTTTNITNTTNTTNKTNTTINATANMTNNTTYKVYNPQSDTYVTVLGEKYDKEVGRWYTYDKDGVRYYNTRI
jgi:flagellar basal body-associated protein FliL